MLGWSWQFGRIPLFSVGHDRVIRPMPWPRKLFSDKLCILLTELDLHYMVGYPHFLKPLLGSIFSVCLVSAFSTANAATPVLTGFSYREAGFSGCQGSAVLRGQDPVRGTQLAAWQYGGKGPGVVNFVIALDGVLQNLAARNAQYEDADGMVRSTYEAEFGDYRISLAFVLKSIKGSEVLAGDGSIRIEHVTQAGDAKVVLISAEEGC